MFAANALQKKCQMSTNYLKISVVIKAASTHYEEKCKKLVLNLVERIKK